MNNHKSKARRPAYCAYLLTLAALCSANKAPAIEPDWLTYEALLKQYVSFGSIAGVDLNRVDYNGLARDPRFTAAIADLEAFDPETLEPGAETIAFYINAYNLFTLRTVVEHLPLASIRDAGSFLRPVWKRDAGSLGGERVSLADIEHGRLRSFGEPRIHFAIVCASVSCPDLRTEAYRAATLDTQLDDQIVRFLGNPKKGLEVSGTRVTLSKIFRWFSADFSAAGGVLDFVRRYYPLPENATLASSIAYNWALNGS